MNRDGSDAFALYLCEQALDHGGWQEEQVECESQGHSAVAEGALVGELVERLHYPGLEEVGIGRQRVETLHAADWRVAEYGSDAGGSSPSDGEFSMLRRLGDMRVVDYSGCASCQTLEHRSELSVECVFRRILHGLAHSLETLANGLWRSSEAYLRPCTGAIARLHACPSAVSASHGGECR